MILVISSPLALSCFLLASEAFPHSTVWNKHRLRLTFPLAFINLLFLTSQVEYIAALKCGGRLVQSQILRTSSRLIKLLHSITAIFYFKTAVVENCMTPHSVDVTWELQCKLWFRVNLQSQCVQYQILGCPWESGWQVLEVIHVEQFLISQLQETLELLFFALLCRPVRSSSLPCL